MPVIKPARAPLTREQQALVTSVMKLTHWFANRAPQWLRRALGHEVIAQEMAIAACKAASDFDSVAYPDYEFSAWAAEGMRRHLMGLTTRTGIKLGVWVQMPELVNGDGDTISLEDVVADHRTDGGNPALAEWHSEENQLLLRAVSLRYQRVLYLRAVEGLTLDEVGTTLGITRERVRQMQEHAAEIIRRARAKLQVDRQLRGQLFP